MRIMCKYRKRFCFSVIAAFLLIAADIWISYFVLTVTYFTVTSPRVTSPLRLVMVSDLHDHEFGAGNRRLAERIRELAPDAILLVGDLLNKDSQDGRVASELIGKLVDLAPVYISYGNQEEDYMARTGKDLKAEWEALGAVVLDEEYIDLEIDGSRLRLGGLYDYAFALDGENTTNPEHMRPELYDFLTDFQDTDRFRLLMVHRPDSLIFGEAADTWSMDLAVAGHLHGGQVRLPFAGGLYAGDQGWFPKYDAGRYQLGKVENLIITRGLSSAQQRLPRFNNPPEIVVIELEPVNLDVR